MLKALGKQVKQFKKDAIATPICMIFEVIFEMLIPYLMMSMIDKGVNVGNMQHIYKVGALMVLRAACCPACSAPSSAHAPAPALRAICAKACSRTFRPFRFKTSTSTAQRDLSPA